MKFNCNMNNWLNLNMNQSHLKYHSPIPRKGIYINCVKLLLALSILKVFFFGICLCRYLKASSHISESVRQSLGDRVNLWIQANSERKFQICCIILKFDNRELFVVNGLQTLTVIHYKSFARTSNMFLSINVKELFDAIRGTEIRT